MAWRPLPVITKDSDQNPVTENQLINLDNIAHFRKWVDGGDGNTDKSVGYSVSGRQYIIDMPLKELENELVSPTT